MRYLIRHRERVVKYIQSGEPMPRRVRKERARILRLGRKKGVV